MIDHAPKSLQEMKKAALAEVKAMKHTLDIDEDGSKRRLPSMKYCFYLTEYVMTTTGSACSACGATEEDAAYEVLRAKNLASKK